MSRTLENKADDLVKNHVMWNVNELIERLKEIEPDNEEIINLNIGPYDEENDSYQEIYTFIQVSEYLGAELKKRGETVEEIYGLTVWGRTTYGQLIAMDYIIEEIAKNLY